MGRNKLLEMSNLAGGLDKVDPVVHGWVLNKRYWWEDPQRHVGAGEWNTPEKQQERICDVVPLVNEEALRRQAECREEASESVGAWLLGGCVFLLGLVALGMFLV